MNRIKALETFWVRCFLIALVLVCVAGVLILPQVDLPNFVVRSGQTSVTNRGFTSTDFVSVSKSFQNLAGSSQTLCFEFNEFGRFVARKIIGAHSVLTQLCTYRC